MPSNPFKPGDVVRLKHCPNDGRYIISCLGDWEGHHRDTTVKFMSGNWDRIESIELAGEPIPIEEGKRYRTRSGLAVGPMKSGGGGYLIHERGDGVSWNLDGGCNTSKGQPYAQDIVREVSNPPFFVVVQEPQRFETREEAEAHASSFPSATIAKAVALVTTTRTVQNLDG